MLLAVYSSRYSPIDLFTLYFLRISNTSPKLATSSNRCLARRQENRQVAVIDFIFARGRILKDVELARMPESEVAGTEPGLLGQKLGVSRSVEGGPGFSLSARFHQGAQVRRDVVSSLLPLIHPRLCVNVARGTRDATERGRSPEDREVPS